MINQEIEEKCSKIGFDFVLQTPIKLDFLKKIYIEIENRQQFYSECQLALNSSSLIDNQSRLQREKQASQQQVKRSNQSPKPIHKCDHNNGSSLAVNQYCYKCYDGNEPGGEEGMQHFEEDERRSDGGQEPPNWEAGPQGCINDGRSSLVDDPEDSN